VTTRNREQNFAMNLLMDPEVDFVTLTGTAGTGKTLLALAAGLTQVLDDRRYTEIIMTRATVSVGEDIGFLPGTEEEKMGPWMGALDDNLEFLAKGDGGNAGEWGRAATNELIRSRIKIKSMNFMRGRTFLNKYVIIDEAQNLTPKQMKTLITRAGPGTKIICMGNLAQIDTPYLTEGSSGLTYRRGPLQGLAPQRPHHAGARRALAPGGLRQRGAVSGDQLDRRAQAGALGRGHQGHAPGGEGRQGHAEEESGPGGGAQPAQPASRWQPSRSAGEQALLLIQQQEERIAQLEQSQRQSLEIIEKLAQQNAQIVATVGALRTGAQRLAWACAILGACVAGLLIHAWRT
jgi:predicted ribonuclease YlaK